MNMAKRKYSKSKKIEPAVLRMQFTVPKSNSEGNGIGYVDLSQCASLVNRRFYRQGINWAVAGITFVNFDSGSGQITISKLPSTWVTSNAWEKTFRAWMQMNKNAMEEAPSIRPKYLDYKVHFDKYHSETLGFDDNLVPDQFTAAVAEWTASTVKIPNSSVTNPTGVPGSVESFYFACLWSYW